MADTKLPALTDLSAPALDDLLYIVDVSDTTDDASGSSFDITLERLLAVGLPVPQGRLTTESGVPISSSNRTAQSTLYYTPFIGNKIALYDGTRWGVHSFTERSFAISGLTSGKNYDVFLYDNSGTLTLELSAAWTNDTTRADALTTQDGIYVKSGATTRRWLGVIRTTDTDKIEDSETNRFVWNLYNQTARPCKSSNNTSHTYTTSTLREWNNGSGVVRAQFVSGFAGLGITVGFFSYMTRSSAGLTGGVAPGLNSTTTPMLGNILAAGSVVDFRGGSVSAGACGLGLNYVTGIEFGLTAVTYLEMYWEFTWPC